MLLLLLLLLWHSLFAFEHGKCHLLLLLPPLLLSYFYSSWVCVCVCVHVCQCMCVRCWFVRKTFTTSPQWTESSSSSSSHRNSNSNNGISNINEKQQQRQRQQQLLLPVRTLLCLRKVEAGVCGLLQSLHRSSLFSSILFYSVSFCSGSERIVQIDNVLVAFFGRELWKRIQSWQELQYAQRSDFELVEGHVS